jgi:integrase
MFPRLLAARVRPGTLDRYKTVVMRFMMWSLTMQLVLVSQEELDFGLMLYAHAGTVRRSEFSCLLAAVRFFLPQVARLPYADESRRGWFNVDPVKHHTPMLHVFVYAASLIACTLGFLRFAAALIVQFEGFLRPGELLKLGRDAVTLPEHGGAFAGKPAAVLSLGTSVRGTKVNRQQVAYITDVWGIAALRFLLFTMEPQQHFLVGLTYPQYLGMFKKVCTRAGFPNFGLHFDPHSPRAGAATQGRFDGLTDAELKTRGRWVSDRSLRIYLDVAMALANRTLQAAAQFQHLLADPSRIGSIFRCV